MNIAIVTGASSGMGREFVRQLSDYVQVDAIWAVARRAEALETLKKEVSVPVYPIVLDLLQDGVGYTAGELVELLSQRYLNSFPDSAQLDISSLRKKLSASARQTHSAAIHTITPIVFFISVTVRYQNWK